MSAGLDLFEHRVGGKQEQLLVALPDVEVLPSPLRNPAGRHYTSYAVDLAQRLGQHNSGVTKSTKNRGPWTLLYQEPFATRSEAMRRERFLKSG